MTLMCRSARRTIVRNTSIAALQLGKLKYVEHFTLGVKILSSTQNLIAFTPN